MLPELKVLLSISEIKNRLITEINQDTIKRLKGQEKHCMRKARSVFPPPPFSLYPYTVYTTKKLSLTFSLNIHLHYLDLI